MPAARREFLRHVVSLGLAASLAPGSLGLFAASNTRAAGGRRRDWPLLPAVDASSGRELLHLPEGFRYFSFGWVGEELAGGGRIPSAADGMGIVRAEGTRLTLIRNHEITGLGGAFAVPEDAYDAACGGGCVRLDLDLDAQRCVHMEARLSGTLVNCAGGVTPWGSWLSCEEIVVGEEQLAGTRMGKPHGLVFEVRPDGPRQPIPLPALGLRRHEAVAIDAHSGDVYLTEDRIPVSGFYRLRPTRPGELQAGGELQMLAVRGRRAADLRGGLEVGRRWPVRWVTIEDPLRAHSPGSRDQGGVVAQGVAAGGARFLRLEGCLARRDGIWFTSTSGGAAGAGQVWRYDPQAEELELVHEVRGEDPIDFPDNIAEGIGDGLLLCEDSQRTPRQRLTWLGRDGRLRVIAENRTRIGGIDHSAAEWAGVCASPDGRWLLANVYRPGYSVAITGPWEDWLAG